MFALCFLSIPGDPKYIRIFDIRVIDVVALFIGTYVLYLLTKIAYWKILIYLLILMVFAHHFFSIRSATDKVLFPENMNVDLLLIIYFIISVIIIYFMNRKYFK